MVIQKLYPLIEVVWQRDSPSKYFTSCSDLPSVCYTSIFQLHILKSCINFQTPIIQKLKFIKMPLVRVTNMRQKKYPVKVMLSLNLLLHDPNIYFKLNKFTFFLLTSYNFNQPIIFRKSIISQR